MQGLRQVIEYLYEEFCPKQIQEPLPTNEPIMDPVIEDPPSEIAQIMDRIDEPKEIIDNKPIQSITLYEYLYSCCKKEKQKQ